MRMQKEGIVTLCVMGAGVTLITEWRRRIDIFGKLLGLGLGLITGQKKGLPSPRAEAGQGNI